MLISHQKLTNNLYNSKTIPNDGDTYYCTTDYRLYVWERGAWHRESLPVYDILRFYQENDCASYCIHCPAMGTVISTPDNDLHFCYILNKDVECKQCTKNDWIRFIIEHI